MKKSVAIHQPEFFPWINLFNKILYADTFVFLDDIQYNRRGFQNRNQILLFGSPSWLTVPLNKSKRSELISNIEIDNTQSWNRSIKSKIVQAYSKSKYFHEVMPIVDDILDREYTFLSDLNCYSIVRIVEYLGLSIDYVKSSGLKVNGKSSDRILNICKSLDTGRYVTGIGSRSYIIESEFDNECISVDYIDPVRCVYNQNGSANGFVSDLSILDYIFNRGPNNFISDMRMASK